MVFRQYDYGEAHQECRSIVLQLMSSIPKKNSAFCMKTSYFMNK